MVEPNTLTSMGYVGATATGAGFVSLQLFDHQILVFVGAALGAFLFSFFAHGYKPLMKIALTIISFLIGVFLTPSVYTIFVNRGLISPTNTTAGGAIAFLISLSIVSIYAYINRRGIKGVAKDIRDVKKGVESDE